jgi:hypothetical protein
MKTSLKLLFLALTTAPLAMGCTASEADGQEGAEQDLVQKQIPDGTVAKVVYSRDDRPVDGAFTSVTVLRTLTGGYDVTVDRSAWDRIQYKEVSKHETIGTNLTCTFKNASGEAHCERDMRPVDGSLTEVDIVANAARGGFDVTRTSTGARAPLKQVDKIAAALKLDSSQTQMAAVSPKLIPDGLVTTAVWSRDERPVDGDLKEIILVRNANSKYDAKLHVSFYDRLNGKVSDQSRTLAIQLDCEFNQVTAEASCSRDARPVDGSLSELAITKTQNADHFAARLDTTAITGEKKTEVLGDAFKLDTAHLTVDQP